VILFTSNGPFPHADKTKWTNSFAVLRPISIVLQTLDKLPTNTMRAFLKSTKSFQKMLSSAVLHTVSHFPDLLINSDMDIKDQFSLFCIDLGRLDQAKDSSLFGSTEKGSDINDNLAII
jgi:hypothetical protein